MMALGVLRKCLREARRERWLVVLTLSFAPFFVALYALAFSGAGASYAVVVVSSDVPALAADGTTFDGGRELLDALASVRDASGRPLLRTSLLADRSMARTRVANREAAALIVVPDGFSRAVASSRAGGGGAPAGEDVAVTFVGDLTNPSYVVAAVLAGGALEEVLQRATGRARPVTIREEPMGGSGARTEFETYVPGILVFAVVLLVFLAAMSVAREIESGTLRRLLLSRMRAVDFVAGTSAYVVLVGIASVVATFLVASALGFRSQGPLWVAVAVGSVTALSVVGVGMTVAAFSRSVTQAFVIANFPLGLLMFFSGAIFPIPPLELVRLGGRPLGPYDLLPPTHAVNALNKVLTLGAGARDVGFELAALALLSLVYFAAGVALLRRMHLRIA